MKLYILDEPPLMFGKGGRHIDIKAGIATHGTFDLAGGTVPDPIGVALIGTSDTVDRVRDWLESCREGVASEEDTLVELRPRFPGMQHALFGTRLNITDHATRVVSRHELSSALAGRGRMRRVVDLFLDHAQDLAARSGTHVLIVAPPAEVFTMADEPERELDPALDDSAEDAPEYKAGFHDAFKARALDLAAPCQMIRPDTYGGGSTRVRGRGRKTERKASLQDPATRAWNFHTALYYKAGGVPWRLVRRAAALDTCYVGTSFFKSLDGERLLTSIAQVFNERGEGLIVQGGNARVDRRDRTAHLSADDARALLARGLGSYRREHMNMPARVVIHKTSYFDRAEIEGFGQAARDERVEILDLVSVRRAGARLFRAAEHAVQRGTVLQTDDRSGLIYLKGTVPYFRTYPGMYVPRALEFTRDDGTTSPLELAKEVLELSKLNFNNTQFDSGDPITVRAARRVGDILKHVGADKNVQSRFRYFT
jgi:hypothetical protein